MAKQLDVDETRKFQTPLYKNVVRTGTVGDGSCLFHAILKGVDSEYSDLPESKKRKYIKKFRQDLAQNITIEYYKHQLNVVSRLNLDLELTEFFEVFYKFIEDPSPFLKGEKNLFSKIISNNTIAYQIITTVIPLSGIVEIRDLKSVSGAFDVDEYTQKLYEEILIAFTRDIKEFDIDDGKIEICQEKIKEIIFQVCDYLIQKEFDEYIRDLTNVSEWGGDYMLRLISYNMDIDIYFIDIHTKQLYNRGCDDVISGKRRAVVIGWIDDSHFESIGVSPSGKPSDIQRVFEPDHPFIQTLRDLSICKNPEANKVEPNKVEPNKVEPNKVEPNKVDPQTKLVIIKEESKNLKIWMEDPDHVYIGPRGIVMVPSGQFYEDGKPKLVRFPTKASIWANPYDTYDEKAYLSYITRKIEEDPIYNIEELRGKTIGCWGVCKHGEVLLELLSLNKNEKNKPKIVENKTKEMGKVYIASMNLRGYQPPRPDGSERLNVTSAQGKENVDRLDFSPMTFIQGGYKGYPNFEAAWQSGKVFDGIPDQKVKKFWKGIKEAKRRYPDSKGAKVLYASFDWCFPEEKMDYVTSRKKVYVPFYTEYIKNKKRALFWKDMVSKGHDVTIYDFDGPRLEDGTPTCLEVNLDLLREKINDTRYPFGHGYTVAAFILGIDSSEFTENKSIPKKSPKKIVESDSEEEEEEEEEKKEESPKGLSYFPAYITKSEEKEFLDFINRQEWSSDLKRRTQHYGYKYPYDTKDKLVQTTPIPKELLPFVDRLNKQFGKTFDQLIVNEYLPGQGISGHIDHPKLFKDTVISLSLGSPCIMNFEMGDDKVEKVLDERSLVVLQDESRYKWKHSIPSRKSDKGVPRKTRVSFTFREIK